jgi:hypothetical protein
VIDWLSKALDCDRKRHDWRRVSLLASLTTYPCDKLVSGLAFPSWSCRSGSHKRHYSCPL